jgi:hypothetical protein
MYQEEYLKTLFNVTFCHKHDSSVPEDDCDDKLILDCLYYIKGTEYSVEIRPSDLVTHKISNISSIIDFLYIKGVNIDEIENLHIIAMTSSEAMKELVEEFSMCDYYRVLSIIQKL